VTIDEDKPLTRCEHCGYGVPSTCRGCGRSLALLAHTWSAREVAQFADLSPRTVQHWAATGVIGPTQEHPQFTAGWRDYYSFADIVAHKVLDALVKGRVPRELAIVVAGEVVQWAGRSVLDPWGPGDGRTPEEWASDAWIIVPLSESARCRHVKDPELEVLLPYDASIPAPAELDARLRPGKWVIPIDAERVAYPIRRAVEDIAHRLDAYLRAHHRLGDLPRWMTE
jgi:hypothetical protein